MANIWMSIANFTGGGLILIIGLVLRFVQESEHMIAGYNTMCKTEQDKWNAINIRLFLGKSFIIISCVLLVGGVLAVLSVYSVLAVIVSWAVFTASIIFSLVYVNTSPKFKAPQK